MLLRRTLILLSALLLLAVPAFGAVKGESAYGKAKESYRALLDSSKKQLYRHNWEKVRNRFLAVRKKYPEHRRAADSYYMAGKTCRGLYRVSGHKKDALEAMEHYDALVRRYPGDTLADDALYLAAEIEETVFRDLAAAYLRYRNIRDNYPKGDMAAKARKKVSALSSHAPPEPKKPVVAKKPKKPKKVAKKVAKKPGKVEVKAIRSFADPGRTRVVIDLDGPADYFANALPGDGKGGSAPRVYIDIKKAGLASGLKAPAPVEGALLRRTRIAQREKDKVRVVFDLTSEQPFNVALLENPSRIVVDLGSPGVGISADPPRLQAPSGDGIADILGQIPADKGPRVQFPVAPSGGGLRRIVVDAGHGGKDPGAIGARGTLEKDVVLALAKDLASQLEKELGCEVILTRDSDVFIPLRERTAIANRVDADLFISVHVNANKNRKIYGIETYYLDFSKNDKALGVAARENGTTLKEVGDLELILFDLMANSKINESSRLASEVQISLIDGLDDHYSEIKDHGVRPGPFHVLLGASMPSVLVEAGFISNKREEKRLKSPKYRQMTAAAIVAGVRKYAKALKLMANQ